MTCGNGYKLQFRQLSRPPASYEARKCVEFSLLRAGSYAQSWNDDVELEETIVWKGPDAHHDLSHIVDPILRDVDYQGLDQF